MDSIEIVVGREEVEFASGLLWAAGVAGIEERDESPSTVRLIAGVPADATTDVVAAIEPRWPVAVGVMDPEPWLDAWRPYAAAVRVTDRIVVQPPWVAPIATPGDIVISVDPLRAWGHGAHPTTTLVVRELAGLADRGGLAGATVLDVGCGSGVLSVAAALLGAQHVLAIDIDPEAVVATDANAAANGVGARVDASTDEVATIAAAPRTVDVVVANIGSRVLTELAASLSAVTSSSGILVLSGLLDEQVDDTLAAYPGFVVTSRAAADGWTAVSLERRRSPAGGVSN